MCRVIMTDSFTHCWKSARRSWLLALVAFCSLLVAPDAACADPLPVEIAQLRLERLDDGVFLSAQVKFDLPPVVEDALLKGIPVYFVAEAHLYRDRWYWYDKKLATTVRHMRLSYHPLTRRWRLSVTQGGAAWSGAGVSLNQNFETMRDALSALSRLSHWKIADATDIELEARHNVDFSFRLDLSELPRPFQIGILGQTDWAISVAKNQRLYIEAAK